MQKNKPVFTLTELLFLFLVFFFTLLMLRIILLRATSDVQVGPQIGLVVAGFCYILSFQVKSLRKKQIFAAWLALALVYLGMYIFFFNSSYLTYIDGYGQKRNYSRYLITPLTSLLFFQACRQFSLFFYKQELGLVIGTWNRIAGEDRTANGIERICSVGMFIIPILSYYLCYYS
jgi:hypothetical protein